MGYLMSLIFFLIEQIQFYFFSYFFGTLGAMAPWFRAGAMLHGDDGQAMMPPGVGDAHRAECAGVQGFAL